MSVASAALNLCFLVSFARFAVVSGATSEVRSARSVSIEATGQIGSSDTAPPGDAMVRKVQRKEKSNTGVSVGTASLSIVTFTIDNVDYIKVLNAGDVYSGIRFLTFAILVGSTSAHGVSYNDVDVGISNPMEHVNQHSTSIRVTAYVNGTEHAYDTLVNTSAVVQSNISQGLLDQDKVGDINATRPVQSGAVVIQNFQISRNQSTLALHLPLPAHEDLFEARKAAMVVEMKSNGLKLWNFWAVLPQNSLAEVEVDALN